MLFWRGVANSNRKHCLCLLVQNNGDCWYYSLYFQKKDGSVIYSYYFDAVLQNGVHLFGILFFVHHKQCWVFNNYLMWCAHCPTTPRLT